jgi:hypothetical protein
VPEVSEHGIVPVEARQPKKKAPEQLRVPMAVLGAVLHS